MANRINAVVASVATSLLMAGCAGTPSVIEGTAVQICRTWKPVFTSKDDKLTDDTIKQIVGNNEANRTWCGETGPPPKPIAKKDAKTS